VAAVTSHTSEQLPESRPDLFRAGVALMKSLLEPALLLLGALVFGGIVASAVFQWSGQRQVLPWGVIFGCLVLGGLTAAALMHFRVSESIAWAAFRGAEWIQRLGPMAWAIVAGITLRLLIWFWVQPEPVSDGAVYLGLAQRLLSGEGYGSADFRAYWPPGMAFALMPFLAAIPSLPVALLVFGLFFFVIGSFGLYRLAQRCGLARWAAVPVWLLALWPTHALFTGLPEKEIILMALVPWGILLAIDAHRQPWAGLMGGLLLGACVLVQPSLQLLPVAWLVLLVMAGVRALAIARTLAIVIIGMAAVIGPWTMRNLQVLGEPVMISTNGGSNLYRVNNDLATGAFVPLGVIDVEALGELEGDREGKRLAIEWIRSHPEKFVHLTFARVLLFPGDNSVGAYAAFRANPDRLSREAYLALKGVAALPWLLAWVSIVCAVATLLRRGRRVPTLVAPVLAVYVYLACIHAIFESGSKYHLPALLTVLLAATLVVKAAREAR
jgi:hypothetical protein